MDANPSPLTLPDRSHESEFLEPPALAADKRDWSPDDVRLAYRLLNG